MSARSTKHTGLGRRLRKIRQYLIETQTTFAARFGLQRHDIANYERGLADLPSRVMGGLDQLGISITWLFTGKGTMLRAESLSPEISDLVLVNRYDIQVSAGHGALAVSEDVVGSMAFKKDWIKKSGLNPKDLALVDVVGDSMEKILREGDLVLIDLSQIRIVSGKAYVIRIGEELLVKYLQHLPGGRIQVVSENSTGYPPFTVNEEDVGTALFIIGRVVASAHTW